MNNPNHENSPTSGSVDLSKKSTRLKLQCNCGEVFLPEQLESVRGRITLPNHNIPGIEVSCPNSHYNIVVLRKNGKLTEIGN